MNAMMCVVLAALGVAAQSFGLKSDAKWVRFSGPILLFLSLGIVWFGLQTPAFLVAAACSALALATVSLATRFSESVIAVALSLLGGALLPAMDFGGQATDPVASLLVLGAAASLLVGWAFVWRTLVAGETVAGLGLGAAAVSGLVFVSLGGAGQSATRGLALPVSNGDGAIFWMASETEAIRVLEVVPDAGAVLLAAAGCFALAGVLGHQWKVQAGLAGLGAVAAVAALGLLMSGDGGVAELDLVLGRNLLGAADAHEVLIQNPRATGLGPFSVDLTSVQPQLAGLLLASGMGVGAVLESVLRREDLKVQSVWSNVWFTAAGFGVLLCLGTLEQHNYGTWTSGAPNVLAAAGLGFLVAAGALFSATDGEHLAVRSARALGVAMALAGFVSMMVGGLATEAGVFGF